MDTIDDIEFVAPNPAMWQPLRTVAQKIFTDTFGHLYDAAAFGQFCHRQYARDGTMAADLANPDVSWRVACHAAQPVGYAKLTPLRAPAPAPLPGALELQQIYVESGWQGSGVAERLMDWAVELAGQRGAPQLYLTVFDHNTRAKRFYARHGFREVGHCTFTLGDEVYDDRIWCKELR
jgi:GNAT superfamily N-acetyltransferase